MLGSYFGTVTQYYNTDNNKVTQIVQNSTLESDDADNDGLSDWEEGLFGTDPLNADTNGDGISDGEEFQSQKVYPELEYEDLGALYGFNQGTQSLWNGGAGNLTGALTQEATLRSFAINESGGLNAKERNNLINNLAQEFTTRGKTPRYTLGNIFFSEQSAPTTINVYLAGILIDFGTYAYIYDVDPLSLLEAWFESQDKSNLEGLSNLGEAYKKFGESIALRIAPHDILEGHLDLVNTLDETARAIENIAQVSTDPVKSMLGAAAYIHYKNKRQNIIAGLTQYVNNLEPSLASNSE